MDFLLIAVLTLLNGVFAMSELSLASSRKSRLSAMADEGDKGARAALALLDQPTQFLSSVQVGITSIGMLNGILGEAAFSVPLSLWLISFGISEGVASVTATAVVVTAITFFTIIFGELVPKRVGQLYPEVVASWVARPMTWVAMVARPFVWLLAQTTQAILTAIRINDSAERTVTEEEIVASLREGRDAGVLDIHEHQMVQNVFHLDERALTSLMVPRGDVQWFDSTLTAKEALAEVASNTDQKSHSWYPVCRGSLDEVLGVVSISDLLRHQSEVNKTLADYVVPVAFLPETLSGMELLEQLRSRSGRMVFVVDEYGVVQGIMTPRDVLEAITGELKPGAASDAWATCRPDGSWVLDGLMPISELKVRLAIDAFPGEGKDLFHTVAGFLMSELGRLPEVGEFVVCDGWVFTVEQLDGWRIERVIARRENG